MARAREYHDRLDGATSGTFNEAALEEFVRMMEIQLGKYCMVGRRHCRVRTQ